MSTSGTYNFNLSNADIVLEAFDRCEIRPTEITGEHMISARRSLNLELQRWSNKGINLWAVDLQMIPLQQGVKTYNVDPATVTMLDTYIRTYQLSTSFNVTPSLTTTAGSNVVTIELPNHGLIPGNWLQFVTPVAIDGMLLNNYYQVNTVLNTNQFTILGPTNALAGVTGGGQLPFFTTLVGSAVLAVNLPNHGLSAGQTFNIGATTTVGNVTLLGSYIVSGVTDANNFGIYGPTVASVTATAYENNGFMNILAQPATVSPIDRVLTPLGRTDYAIISDKDTQGIPTQYWFDRLIDPTVTMYQPPDGNGPYLLMFYRLRRLQDANLSMNENPDAPYRFLDALCAGVAERLAMKYNKNLLEVLTPAANAAWMEATTEDRERADTYITPALSTYWRM